MTLGIFLSLGDSFKNMAKTGQDIRFKKYYVKAYAKEFEKVFIFTYDNEKVTGLPKNVYIIPNRYSIHRYIYSLIIPFLHFSIVKQASVFRSFHLNGTIPSIISKIFFSKPFVFNFAYNYEKFAAVENKRSQVVLFKLVKPMAVFLASKILAANETIFKSLPHEKAVYSPNGVDITTFKPSGKKVKKKVHHILAVGRLEKQKNFEGLIKSMSTIKADLTIVGSGQLKSELIKLAKREKVNIRIIEKVKNNRMPRVYNWADIFILTSFTEGSPKALLEAMSSGLPCIAANISENRELISNMKNGILVDLNITKIRDIIDKLLSNKKLRIHLGKNARKQIVENFDIRRLIEKELVTLKNG